jgi:hypothetical protein
VLGHDDRLRCEVVGKALGRLDQIVVAIAATRQLDQPYKVWAYDVAPPVVAGDHVYAARRGSGWNVRGRGIAETTIDADEHDTVLGVLTSGREQDPALVTVSQSGMIVRLRSASEVKTLTASSGPALARALHPGLGLLAIQHDEESVEVRELLTGEIVVTVQAR